MPGRSYIFDDFRFEVQARVLWKGGVLVSLTPKEVEALTISIENAGRPVSKEQLVERLWGADTHLRCRAIPSAQNEYAGDKNSKSANAQAKALR